MRATVLGSARPGPCTRVGLVDARVDGHGLRPGGQRHPGRRRPGGERGGRRPRRGRGAQPGRRQGRRGGGRRSPRSSGTSAVYADMNAGDPAVKRQIAATVGAHRFADVSVIGSVPTYGAATSVVISGAGSMQAARVFAELGAPVEDIGGAPGDASARKLLRSTFMKGLGALIVESGAAGRAAGAEEWMRTQIANELNGGEAALDRLHDGTIKHAARRATETAAAADLLDSLGQRPVMTRAAAELHQQLADAALAPIDDLVAASARSPWPTSATPVTAWACSTPASAHRGGEPGWSAGPARSGRGRATTRPSTGSCRSCRPGDVLVVNGGGDTTRALIGELIAEKAKASGVVGMIIDGVVRDGVELERIGFPVWSRGLCPAGPYKNGPGQHRRAGRRRRRRRLPR